MKKLLLSSAAICGLALASSPAHAQVELELGGYFKGYGAFVDQDEPTAGDAVNDFDIVRQTEIHFTGETTLDNGLTVGYHFETDADGDDSLDIDESYAYFSGNWGRVNFGAEDGAAYLLQVAAPSADSNIDGIRQFINPVNYDVFTGTFFGAGTEAAFDYDQDPSGKSDKFTYMTPIFNGFQAGVTFSPDTDAADDLEGIGTDDLVEDGQSYELAVRYEGQFEKVGVIVGAGYSHVELEDTNPVAAGELTDDREVFNVGVDLDFGPFGLGVIYKEDNFNDTRNAADDGEIDEEEVFVIGADYTTGPFKLGLNYYDADNSLGIDTLETRRYSGGVTYTYGPGMTMRGSIGYVEHEAGAAVFSGDDEIEATYVTIGTQINF